MLCFSTLSTGHGKGLFIAPAVTSVLRSCPLNRLCLVWVYLPTTLCDTHPRQIEADLFYSSVCRSISSCHDINAFWALRVLPFQICPRVCLLLMCLPQPGDSPSAFPGLSCELSFGFSLHLGAGPRMIMGFTFLWPTFGFLHCLPC